MSVKRNTRRKFLKTIATRTAFLGLSPAPRDAVAANLGQAARLNFLWISCAHMSVNRID
ncbi:twin-arginine translocation signal domain-containing protein [Candidatus Sumerlaeota bacterium]